jgi:hypothetical protein
MSQKTVVSVAVVAAAACVGLYLSRGPWMAYREQKLKADAATQEMLKAERNKTDLLREKARVETPMGREEAARAVGYVKKNELPLDQAGK